MLNLIKYEALKRWKPIMVALIIIGILEMIVIVMLNKKEDYLAFGMFIFMLLGFAGLIFLLVDNINTYKDDLFKKTGYMLFLTPNNGYKILGSKVITALIENIVGFIIYFLLGILNVSILYSMFVKNGVVNLGIVNFNITIEPRDVLTIFLIGLMIICSWFNLMLSIYLAMTIYKSILSNIKHGGIISFLLFLVINFILIKIYWVFNNNTFNTFVLELNLENITNILGPNFLIEILMGISLFLITGYLLDKKVNL